MTNREQAIKRVAEVTGYAEAYVKSMIEAWPKDLLGYAVDTTERVLELEAALKEIANTSSAIWHDMDENAMGRSTMRLIAREARAALHPKGE